MTPRTRCRLTRLRKAQTLEDMLLGALIGVLAFGLLSVFLNPL